MNLISRKNSVQKRLIEECVPAGDRESSQNNKLQRVPSLSTPLFFPLSFSHYSICFLYIAYEVMVIIMMMMILLYWWRSLMIVIDKYTHKRGYVDFTSFKVGLKWRVLLGMIFKKSSKHEINNLHDEAEEHQKYLLETKEKLDFTISKFFDLESWFDEKNKQLTEQDYLVEDICTFQSQIKVVYNQLRQIISFHLPFTTQLFYADKNIIILIKINSSLSSLQTNVYLNNITNITNPTNTTITLIIYWHQ